MDFRALALGLVGVVLAATAASAQSGQRTSTLALSIDGSLPLGYSDNTFRNPRGRSDYKTSPYLGLSAHGHLTSDLSYSVYSSAGFDKYPSHSSDDNTFAALGTSLTKRSGQLAFGASYQRSYSYDGIFGPAPHVSNNVGVYANYAYKDPMGLFRLKPGISLHRRFAEDPSNDRYSYQFKLDIERKLHDRWSFTLTPLIRRQHYIGSPNNGVVETIYSISSGLRYSHSDHLSVSGGFNYDQRESTNDARRTHSLGVGLSLDFHHTFHILR